MAKFQKGINDLETWCLNNGEFGQKLMTEWTGIRDDGRRCIIDKVSYGSAKKFKWICSKRHEWFAKLNDRTSHKSGCPYCSGKRVSNENNLKAWCLNNGEFGKQLIQEWTGECKDGTHYKLSDVTKASGKKFKWKCSKGHEWTAQVISRTYYRVGCPYCSGLYVSNGNSLKTWCLNNGAFGKQLMSEWTGECEDNEHYKIDEISYGSSTKKFKWRCSKGHEWHTDVLHRTIGRSCPYCNNSTSYPEQFIYHSLKQIYPNTETRCKVLRSTQNPQGVEFDIGIPDIPLCIEYSSTYWHKGREERDQYKKDLCEQCGVRLIQIIEDSYNELEHIKSDNYICFKMNQYYRDDILTKIVDHTLKTLGHSISEIDLKKAKNNAWDSCKGHI